MPRLRPTFQSDQVHTWTLPMPDQPSEHAEARPSSNLRTWLRALMDLTDAQPLDILPAWAIMVCLWPSFQWDLQAGM